MIALLLFIVPCGAVENELLTLPRYILFRNDTLFQNGTFQVNDTNEGPVTDLDALVESNLFVDKTNVIKRFFEVKEYVVMVSAPARFGKSIVLELIKRFCEIAAFENFTMNEEKMNSNIDFFSLNNFDITKDESFLTQHFGRHPVIFLDFKNICVKSWESFYASFKRLVMTTFNRHRYVLQSFDLHEKERNRYLDFYLGKKKNNPYVTILYSEQTMTEDDLLNSIFTLTYLVHYSLNQSMCVLMIDNYDAPVMEAMSNLHGGQQGNDTKRIIRYLYRFAELLIKPDQYVMRVILSVRQRVGPIRHINDIPMMNYYPFCLNNQLSSFYGFTEREVKTLLHKRKLLHKLEEVRDWYGGYTVYNSTLKLFNPYSVVKYLETNELKIHWPTTSYLKNCKKLFLHKLINSRVKRIAKRITKINYVEVLTDETIYKLRDIINNIDTFKFTKKLEVEAVLQILVDIGFFNVDHLTFTRDEAVVNIPNNEIREFFYQEGILPKP